MRERGGAPLHRELRASLPHCWRCKNPVIFRATPQWFISMDRAGGGVIEKDEDGRDRSNFTENFIEGMDILPSARGSFAGESDACDGFLPGASIVCVTCSKGGLIGGVLAPCAFGASHTRILFFELYRSSGRSVDHQSRR